MVSEVSLWVGWGGASARWRSLRLKDPACADGHSRTRGCGAWHAAREGVQASGLPAPAAAGPRAGRGMTGGWPQAQRKAPLPCEALALQFFPYILRCTHQLQYYFILGNQVPKQYCTYTTVQYCCTAARVWPPTSLRLPKAAKTALLRCTRQWHWGGVPLLGSQLLLGTVHPCGVVAMFLCPQG